MNAADLASSYDLAVIGGRQGCLVPVCEGMKIETQIFFVILSAAKDLALVACEPFDTGARSFATLRTTEWSVTL